jgi:hypothetical protein
MAWRGSERPLKTARCKPTFGFFAPPPSGGARPSNRAVQVQSPSRCGPVPGKEAADRQKKHEIGSLALRRQAPQRALSPDGAVLAAGHPIPPSANVTNHAAILRARRKRAAWGDDGSKVHTRHRCGSKAGTAPPDAPRAGKSHPERARKHEYPGLPDRQRHESQQAGSGPDAAGPFDHRESRIRTIQSIGLKRLLQQPPWGGALPDPPHTR